MKRMQEAKLPSFLAQNHLKKNPRIIFPPTLSKLLIELGRG